jgi:hypothetical protein
MVLRIDDRAVDNNNSGQIMTTSWIVDWYSSKPKIVSSRVWALLSVTGRAIVIEEFEIVFAESSSSMYRGPELSTCGLSTETNTAGWIFHPGK